MSDPHFLLSILTGVTSQSCSFGSRSVSSIEGTEFLRRYKSIHQMTLFHVIQIVDKALYMAVSCFIRNFVSTLMLRSTFLPCLVLNLIFVSVTTPLHDSRSPTIDHSSSSSRTILPSSPNPCSSSPQAITYGSENDEVRCRLSALELFLFPCSSFLKCNSSAGKRCKVGSVFLVFWL